MKDGLFAVPTLVLAFCASRQVSVLAVNDAFSFPYYAIDLITSEIYAKNNPEGGAAFTFWLELEESNE